MSAPDDKVVEAIPDYFAKPGVTEGLAQAHPVLLVRQMANEIMRLRGLPSTARPPERGIGLPRGWSLRREGDGIVVSHEQEGSVFVREDTSRSIAECILFYLADDLMDPAMPRRYLSSSKGRSDYVQFLRGVQATFVREEERRFMDEIICALSAKGRTCPRCGDEYTGQACVADCPLLGTVDRTTKL